MPNYTSEEEKIILKNNDEITSIDLEDNLNLKILIIDNLSKLEKVTICVNDRLYVSISNCEKLTNVFNFHITFNYNLYGSYLYLGENLKSLNSISLSNFTIFKLADEAFNELESLTLSDINSLICNFKNFPKLDYLRLANLNTQNLILNSETISYLDISRCSFENIEIIGNGNINYFEFNNNEYKSLKTENPIKATDISLHNDNNNKTVSYIPLSDEIDEVINIKINIDNVYDSEYKYFIERNLSKINLIDYDSYDEITLDDIKFSVPQKKRAR